MQRIPAGYFRSLLNLPLFYRTDLYLLRQIGDLPFFSGQPKRLASDTSKAQVVPFRKSPSEFGGKGDRGLLFPLRDDTLPAEQADTDAKDYIVEHYEDPSSHQN